MSAELYAAFLLFAFISAATPGPNNLMLMASGANFGVRRTLPHMLGIVLGFVGLTALSGLGLAGLLARLPSLEGGLRLLAGLWILRIAWSLATSSPAAPDEPQPVGARPMRLWEAAAFQWVNPKAWAMALAALATYVPGRDIISVAIVAATFGALVIPLALVWAAGGRFLGRLLGDARTRRLFNRAMAVLLVVSVVPALLG